MFNAYCREISFYRFSTLDFVDCLSFSSSPIVFSQNTFTNSGTNVGIGTTTPQERLEIVTSGLSNLQLSNSGNVFGAVGALKFSMAGTHVGGIEMERTISAGTLSTMKFLIRSGSGVTGEFMRITQDQRLGIGTSSPGRSCNNKNLEMEVGWICMTMARECKILRLEGGMLLIR